MDLKASVASSVCNTISVFDFALPDDCPWQDVHKIAPCSSGNSLSTGSLPQQEKTM